MTPSDPALPLLTRALKALWVEAVTTTPSGALAMLEPRVVAEGPRCMTDGEVLWVDAWALREWLREPSSLKGCRTLAAAGLELLYFWLGKPGPWLIPPTSSDVVLTSGPLPHRADWILAVQHPQTREDRDAANPDPSWQAGQWWHAQPVGMWTGKMALHDPVVFPDYWENDGEATSLTLAQARAMWRACVRDLRQLEGPGDGQVEREWIDACLADHPEELHEWMALEPPISVSREALFSLRDPQWVEAFLRRGAQADAVSIGQCPIHHAAQHAPHMLEPLWKAGVAPQIPLSELLVMVVIGNHHTDQDVAQAIQAARFVMAQMEQAGEPFDWAGHVDLLSPILPRSLLATERRLEVLEALWPEGLHLGDLVPELEIVDDNGKGCTWPLPLALGALAAKELIGGKASRKTLGERLAILQRMGVCFDTTFPEGGVFHAAMLHCLSPDVAQDVYEVLMEAGANWRALDRKGRCARTQKAWEKGVLRRRQHEGLPWDKLDAMDLARRMDQALAQSQEGQGAARGRL